MSLLMGFNYPFSIVIVIHPLVGNFEQDDTVK